MDRRFARLKLPAKADSLPLFLEFAHAGAQEAGLTPSERDRLDLVLEELLFNVVRYAYQPGNGDVELAYALDESGDLLVEISDQGRVFNPLDQPEPDLEARLEDRPVGGLGIFLARRLVDSLAYSRKDGRNIISFHFPGPERPGT